MLTRIEHDAHLEGDYRSYQELTFKYGNRFTCIPGALPYRPQRVTKKPTIAGVQTATVVGPAGEEIFCDKYGRVKVQFNWDRAGKKDANSSCWLRVAQVWAGNGWGAFFWPRVGHEVVVTFEEGDPDQPVIIGSVYNAENMPPLALTRGEQVLPASNRPACAATPARISTPSPSLMSKDRNILRFTRSDIWSYSRIRRSFAERPPSLSSSPRRKHGDCRFVAGSRWEWRRASAESSGCVRELA